MKIPLWISLLLINGFAFQLDQKQQLEIYIRNQLNDTQSIGDIKCGTQMALLIHYYHDQIDSELYQRYQNEIKLEPEWERSLVSASGYFLLHWMESGFNSVPLDDMSGNGYPDYIDSAAVIFDKVRQIEVDNMNYKPPPAQDGSAARPYSIYFAARSDYGVTVPSYIDIPSLPGVNYTSYIILDNDYQDNFFPTKGLDALRVTAAHEFHHAIQLGYNFRSEDGYLREMTSTWMEDTIYPDVNDYYNYLPTLFNNVSNSRFDLSLGAYPYGNSIYLKMLEFYFGSDIVRSVWDRILLEPGLDALKYTLDNNNSTWLESLAEYGLWLYYTGDRALSGQFFKDAVYYPEVRVMGVDKFTYEDELTEYLTLETISNRFIEVYNLRGKILTTEVTVSDTPLGGFRLLNESIYSVLEPFNQPILGMPQGSDTLTLIFTNSEFAYIAATINIATSGEIDLTSIYPFPNPVNLNATEAINFQNVPAEAEIYIFNTRGRRISVLKNQGKSAVRYWNLNNEMGEKVAAGIYMYVVQGEGLFKTGKFSLIR